MAKDLFCFDAPQLTQGMTVTCAEWNSNNKDGGVTGWETILFRDSFKTLPNQKRTEAPHDVACIPVLIDCIGIPGNEILTVVNDIPVTDVGF